ncbi:hypothetical protein PG993_013694 [Apiospora rasikravindrae]|uniref:Uncharacterized protein n=1 Tax=Apiospora rasikravindrae TaxID=990691 RepID=A0ABR1RQX1_9PEZI
MPRNEISSSRLKSLPVDLLVELLSASESLADLHAFIRAPPWLYEVFREWKKTIVLAVVSKNLGPALRDYVALSMTSKLDPNRSSYNADVRRAIQNYRNLPTGAKLARQISFDTVIAVIRFKPTVHMLIGLYEKNRLFLLDSIEPAAATPITSCEYQRLSQAMVRYRILTLIYPWLSPLADNGKYGTKDVKSLYQSEKDRPRLSAGSSAEDPPFGWVDAMRGLDTCRWGYDLDMCFCEVESPPYHAHYLNLLGWRMLGFVFWDKDRIQLLQQRLLEEAPKSGYQSDLRTGWLEDTWSPEAVKYCWVQ